MAHAGLRFGIFLAPFHQLGDNPTLALERDLELIEWLDHLGYDEAWIGEHHSAGWEIIASPEIFIAAAAQRTKRIMLGSGVTSLPYHHPFLVAQRFVHIGLCCRNARARRWRLVAGDLLSADARPERQRRANRRVRGYDEARFRHFRAGGRPGFRSGRSRPCHY